MANRDAASLLLASAIVEARSFALELPRMPMTLLPLPFDGVDSDGTASVIVVFASLFVDAGMVVDDALPDDGVANVARQAAAVASAPPRRSGDDKCGAATKQDREVLVALAVTDVVLALFGDKGLSFSTSSSSSSSSSLVARPPPSPLFTVAFPSPSLSCHCFVLLYRASFLARWSRSCCDKLAIVFLLLHTG